MEKIDYTRILIHTMLLYIICNKCSKIWIQKYLKYYTLNMGVRSGLFRVFNNEKP